MGKTVRQLVLEVDRAFVAGKPAWREVRREIDRLAEENARLRSLLKRARDGLRAWNGVDAWTPREETEYAALLAEIEEEVGRE